jgi:DNA-binding NarL/FixJ family response regulator
MLRGVIEPGPSFKKPMRIKGKVLLVEDDSQVGPWLKSKLQRTGIQCDLAVNLQDALKIFSENLYHAVVTDIFLSGTGEPDGLEVVKRVEPTGMPLIIISSAADLKIAKEAMNHGASYLLEKPFEPETLIKELERLWEEPKGLQAMVERFLDMHSLTPKEKEVVRLLLKGLSNKEVAEIGGNSPRTIKFHLTSIFEKCGVKSRTELFNSILPT